MHLLLASWLDPFVAFIWLVVEHINAVIGNLGWSLVILAALIRGAFWALNVKQFKAMLSMQRVAPKIKAIQERYKGDQQRIQQETMALYREAGVNPLAGCLPMLVQLPILYSVYWVIALNDTITKTVHNHPVPNSVCRSASMPDWFSTFPLHHLLHPICFDKQTFLWVNPTFAAHLPHIIGANLAGADVILLALYAGSMYFSMRYASVPSTDAQQAQMQRMMAMFSPLLLAYFGWRSQWPSAMILYWFAYNAFTMAQQMYMLRRYHQPLAMLDSEHVAGDDGAGRQAALGNGASKRPAAIAQDGAATNGSESPDAQGTLATRKRRRKRKRKR
ncbi:MAG: YidC/Oxa1 family membrane protein insertase [Candidatus Tyrphobacter sp.]